MSYDPASWHNAYPKEDAPAMIPLPPDYSGLAARESSPIKLELPPRTKVQCPDGTAASPTGVRECQNSTSKPKFHLIPPEAEEAMARVLTFGSTKYEPRNWEKGLAFSDIISPLRRHLNAYLQGEVLEHESGLPVTWFILTNAAMLVAMELRRPDLNDLPRIQHRGS